MERQQAITEIRNRWKELYPADNSGKGIICPLCGSGSGAHGTGITENRGNPGQLKCWNCDFNGSGAGDVIDLIQLDKGIDFADALEYAAEQLHIDVDRGHSNAFESRKPAPRDNIPADRKTPAGPAETPNYSEYYRQCAERLKDRNAVSYLTARGISIETAAAYNLGFDPNADPASAPGATGNEYRPHQCARIIIPFDAGHYMGRSIDPNTPKEFRKLNNKKAGNADTIPLFNIDCIYSAETAFITEGAIDALSIIEAGSAAAALNSTSNVDKLLKQLESRPTAATLIICLDNDDAGKKAAQRLKDGLQRLNISYITADICNGHKDPNDALIADRAGFIAAIRKAEQQNAARPDNVSSYIDGLFVDDIETFKENANNKTGYSNLDAAAGGIYSGVYVIAAISSLGKTTFAHQMADQIAAAGNDVLYFSLEQSRFELTSKSLARITAQGNINTAVTSLQIRRGEITQSVLQAVKDYKDRIQDRLSIIEGNFSCNVSFIGDYTRRYIRNTGCKPTVFIDYLQILQGEPDKRQTARETIDLTITELKRLSRELDITVFIISSVNRANYLTPIDFESLKESGGIEFTADVIYGLQLQCLNDEIFDKKENIKEKRNVIKEAKAEEPRKIELVCLKNRYGKTGFSCYFDYFPANDLFIPGELQKEYKLHKPQKGAKFV